MKSQSLANPDVQRLYDDLLIRYSPLVRPVKNPSDVLKVWFKIRLFQLLDIHEKNQIMTTNVWLSHVSNYFFRVYFLKFLDVFMIRNGTISN